MQKDAFSGDIKCLQGPKWFPFAKILSSTARAIHESVVVTDPPGGRLATRFISVAVTESYHLRSRIAIPKRRFFLSVPVSGNINNQLPAARSFHRVGTSPRGLAQWRRRLGWEICSRVVREHSDHSRMLGKAEAPDRQSLLRRRFPYCFRLPGTRRDLLKHRWKYWLGGDWGGAAADEIC
jgi:hypothetical protein